MRCALCQTNCVPDAQGLCPACRKPQIDAPACRSCGFDNPPGFRFCGQCGVSLATSDAISNPAPIDAERRQLTILFCDLVGSTRLSNRMDPEDYHALLMAYRTTGMQSIEHYGGSEVRHIGDGTQAYFGYPRAQEDAAERAVLTALAMINGVTRLGMSSRWNDAGLAVRIGIGSGTVITDRQSNPDGAGMNLTEALGETPNLAARIQNVAPVNSVVIDPLTRQLLGNLFTLIDRGEQTFKGIDKQVHVWQVEGVAALDRFEATRSSTAVLVNRVEEMPKLLHCWDEAQRGQGRVVVLSGEGGIGKSRIARALHDRIAEKERPATLYLQCSPIYDNTALYPIVALIQERARLHDTDSPLAKRDKVGRLLARSGTSTTRLLPLLTALLDIQDDPEQVARLDWRELREQLNQSLIEHVQRLSTRRTLLIVFEDLQWVDPSTLELLERIVDAIREHRVMILAVCRPEVLLPWFKRSHVTIMPLGRFRPDHTEALASRVAEGRRLPPEVIAQIIETTAGVPLFVEEIVKTLLASGQLKIEGDTCVLDGPLPLLAIPPTLADSLMARLDQLGSNRRFAQLGAVIGRDFTLELLATVAAEPEDIVEASLESLVTAGILGRHGTGAQTVFAFSHALMREATLSSMLRNQRQRMHAAVAQSLETRFPSVGQSNPELLAHHHGEAAQADQAIDYWLLAGQRSSRRSETLEAINHLRSGLALIPSDDQSESTLIRRLQLLIALGPALITHIGPGADEVRECYRQALSLCERLPESAAHFAAHWGWWRIARNFVDKRTTAYTLLTLAQHLNDPGLILEAHHALWATRFVLGEQALSLEHVEQGLALYRDGDYHDHAATYGGHDAQVCGEGEAALVLWLTGHPRRATQRMETALSLADRLEHVGSQAHAVDYALMLDFYRRDVTSVRRHANEQLALAARHHLGDYEARAHVFLGWALALQGEYDSGLLALRKGMQAQQSSGTTEDFPIFFSMQAEIHLHEGRPAEAKAVLIEASDYAAEQQVKLWDAEILRLQAIASVMSTPQQAPGMQAIEDLCTALRIARNQDACMLEYKVIETTLALFGTAASGRADGSTREPFDLAILDRSMSDALTGESPVDLSNDRSRSAIDRLRRLANEALLPT